jgi:hypothetical protein
MTELLDPTTGASAQSIAYAPRPGSLRGKRVALIENTKFNSDKLLQRIGDILVEEYGVGSTRMFRKRNAGVPAHQEIVDEVRRTCDLVVAGVGD